MPDSRSHRGPDPRDAGAFADAAHLVLRTATADLSWLLGKGYSTTAALKLVGDRYGLTERQRRAVVRSACPDDRLAARRCRAVEPDEVAGQPVWIDGFNVLTTIEAALGGAVVLIGRDGALRDIAGVHGTYRRVEETRPAVLLAGEILAALQAGPCLWLLDRPVSKSGRLRGLLLETAQERGWDWAVELPFDPDPELAGARAIVATSDSVILDACPAWLGLARWVVEGRVPGAWRVDLEAVA